ncbi:hypothetical protein, partial [Aestuariivirga sp.]|uniref:hypothetical protein n=1 Tax=Aestuariivirga sp. TaxID=2650926 RepID=UPI0025C401E6
MRQHALKESWIPAFAGMTAGREQIMRTDLTRLRASLGACLDNLIFVAFVQWVQRDVLAHVAALASLQRLWAVQI